MSDENQKCPLCQNKKAWEEQEHKHVDDCSKHGIGSATPEEEAGCATLIRGLQPLWGFLSFRTKLDIRERVRAVYGECGISEFNATGLNATEPRL